MCINKSGGFESPGGRRSDGLKGEKHRDRHDFGDVGGKLAASDEDEDRHRSSRGSRQSHKSSASLQGKFYSQVIECCELHALQLFAADFYLHCVHIFENFKPPNLYVAADINRKCLEYGNPYPKGL